MATSNAGNTPPEPEWLHLTPLIDKLVTSGNRLAESGHGLIFQPSQGGPICLLEQPIDFTVAKTVERRAEVRLVEDEDYIWCSHCWSQIQGKQYQLKAHEL